MKNLLIELLREGAGEQSNAGGGDGTPPAEGGEGTPPAEGEVKTGEAEPKSAEGEAAPSALTDPKEGEATPKEGEAEATPALTAEDIKLPEGFTASDEVQAELLSIVNNAELAPADRVNQMIAMHGKLMQEQNEKEVTAWIERQTAAGKDLMEKSDLGGDKWPETATAVSTVLSQFGSDKLKEEIAASGLGNSYEFAKFLTAIHPLISEGKPVVGDPTSGDEPASDGELFYPNQGKV